MFSLMFGVKRAEFRAELQALPHVLPPTILIPHKNTRCTNLM
jgi:hypothetical protein